MRPMKILWVATLAVMTQNAFAEETSKAPQVPGPSPEILAAKNKMLSRHGRLMQINAWLAEGVLGENNEGLLSLRGRSRRSVELAMKDENEDREKSFKELSRKTATTVMAQRKLFAKKRREESPKGSPVQKADGSWGIKA